MITIRQARPDDAAACAEIYAPHVRTTTSFELEAPDAPTMATRIEAAHVWLVAETDRVVGFAYGGRHRERPAYAHTCEVSVYVAQPGHGIGRALYRQLLPRLAVKGMHVALAAITLPNEPSERMHAALGFRPVGVFHEVGHKLGEWRDVGWWELVLEDQRERRAGIAGPPRVGG